MDLFGSKTGVVCGEREFTYAQFGERCERLATGLTRLGVREQDVVAFLSFNTHTLLEGYYGVVQARAIALPLNVRLSEGELAAILDHSEARMVCFEPDFAAVAESLREKCPRVQWWVSLGEKIPPAELTYEEILAGGNPARADICSYDELSPAELFYTSGSTGIPKGVTLSHRTLYLHALSVGMCYSRPESMVELHTIPLFHANGWGRPQVATMLGVKQIMVRRFDPTGVFRLIQEHRATDMSMVPAMVNALVNAPDRAQWDLSSLRCITIGGAANSPALVRRVEQAFPGCRCWSGYGLTETSPVLTVSGPRENQGIAEDQRIMRQAMAGVPILNTSLRVVDAEMRDVPRDGHAIGEIVTMSDHVMDGYFKDPEGTKAVMTGPWFHTGDMAVWDEQGYVHIVDRKKEIIISGGENISSIEVEKAIFAHPGVLECAVVSAPDAKWGEVPAAIVVLKPEAELDEATLLAFLEDKIARYKFPRIVRFQREPLAKTGTGKIRKLILKEQFWEGKEKRVQG